ncbi:hypothetical protein F0562_017977 [Nyssa sinensis]|uniref:Uncharacterized protein n=1 Tax=Nyssa sinensis TaxID=561372 RepID=A0A5J4ZB49_9ASTE|nr:hypothetical protein F0562_017977 [Nyssa sinensis]
MLKAKPQPQDAAPKVVAIFHHLLITVAHQGIDQYGKTLSSKAWQIPSTTPTEMAQPGIPQNSTDPSPNCPYQWPNSLTKRLAVPIRSTDPSPSLPTTVNGGIDQYGKTLSSKAWQIPSTTPTEMAQLGIPQNSTDPSANCPYQWPNSLTKRLAVPIRSTDPSPSLPTTVNGVIRRIPISL